MDYILDDITTKHKKSFRQLKKDFKMMKGRLVSVKVKYN